VTAPFRRANVPQRRRSGQPMANTAEDLYELVRQLPAAERLRLVEKIAHDLHATGLPEPAVGRPFEWTQLAGAAPGLLGGDT
jgi:hypothetical protein